MLFEANFTPVLINVEFAVFCFFFLGLPSFLQGLAAGIEQDSAGSGDAFMGWFFFERVLAFFNFFFQLSNH